MKKIADSVILASINLLLIAFAYGSDYLESRSVVPGVLILVVVPPLFLFTVVFAVRDLIRSTTRLQATLAFLFSIPTAILLWSIKL